MPMGNEPTHPKITDDADNVEGHGFRWGVDAEPEPVGQRKVGGTPERADDDTEGHAVRIKGPLADDDVEGHGRWKGVDADEDDVEGHRHSFRV